MCAMPQAGCAAPHRKLAAICKLQQHCHRITSARKHRQLMHKVCQALLYQADFLVFSVTDLQTADNACLLLITQQLAL